MVATSEDREALGQADTAGPAAAQVEAETVTCNAPGCEERAVRFVAWPQWVYDEGDAVCGAHWEEVGQAVREARRL